MFNEIDYKVMPHSLEAEQSIFHSCIVNTADLETVLDTLSPEDFYRMAHQKIFRAIQEVYKQDEMADLVLIAERLKDKGQLSEVGGVVYLAKITDTPSAIKVEATCEVIKKAAVLRKLITASNDIIKNCFNGGEEALDKAQATMLGIESGRKCEYQTIAELLPDQIDHLERLSLRSGYITGISSGFDDLDRLTCGFQNTDLILLAARPGMGKTAMALNIAINMQVPVAVFSLEMSKKQLINRALSSEAEINGQKFRSGNFHQTDWHDLNIAAERLSEAPITIIDTPMMTYQEIVRESRRLKKKAGIKMVIVDYLQFIEGDRNLKENYRFAEISKNLKGAAKTLDMPFLVLAQLNRKLEERNNKRPKMSDLRDSGNLEQDADLVMFLYRPEVYGVKDSAGQDQKGVAELILAKQRNGPTGTVGLNWNEQFTKFKSLEMRHG